MSFMGNFAGSKAMKAHSKGDHAKALELYHQAYEKGMDAPNMLRGYCVLLIRNQNYERAIEVIRKLEKIPNLPASHRTDMKMHYAVILSQKGHLDRAIEILEEEFKAHKNGTLYSTLGYLKIEKGDFEDALAFNLEAVEYDEEDGVFLDNLAQTYYRLGNDKEKAKEYFDKAIALRPKAIDTNYFLALYDIENGDYEKAKLRLKIAKAGYFSPLNYATPEKIDELLAQLNA